MTYSSALSRVNLEQVSKWEGGQQKQGERSGEWEAVLGHQIQHGAFREGESLLLMFPLPPLQRRFGREGPRAKFSSFNTVPGAGAECDNLGKGLSFSIMPLTAARS